MINTGVNAALALMTRPCLICSASSTVSGIGVSLSSARWEGP
ncbi:hypothetical protein [Deinococcus rubellus]